MSGGYPGGLGNASWKDLDGFAMLVDLTLGAWRARDAALQLAEAAGIALPMPERVYNGDDPETIGQGVDAEARGPLAVLVAAQDARALADALPHGCSIGVLCRERVPPFDENLWTLTFLARLGHRVVWLLQSEERDNVARNLPPDQRVLLQLFPGPLPDALAERAGLAECDDVFLPNFRPVIRPEFRATLERTKPGLLARLARFESDDTRIQLMCQVYGPGYYADAEWLTETGMRLFRDGAEILALRALARAVDIANGPSQRAAAELSLQGVRVFAHRFAEAAGHPAPGTDLPEAVCAQLAVLKGWAEIAGPDPEAGLRRIAGALQAAGAAEPKTAEDLFILNIAALGQLRTGATETALETEFSIERALGVSGGRLDPRAEFINALNLSRLHRRQGDTAAYRRQLDRALATSQGVRSLSDLVQMNLMRAEPGGSDESPRSHVLRAVLAWLALSPPEALAVRAMRLTGARPGDETDIDAAVCEALLAHLEAAFPELEPAQGQGQGRIVVMEDAAGKGTLAIGTPNAAVLLLTEDPVRHDLRPDSPARANLTALALATLADDCPELASHPSPILGIDSDFGTNIPAGRDGLTRLALTHDLTMGMWCDTAVAWDRGARIAAGIAADARLSPGISPPRQTEEALVVPFKRYRAAARLTGDTARFVRHLQDGAARVEDVSRGIGLDPRAGLDIARSLQAQRIVTLEYAPCIADGIRSPIRATSGSR